MAIQYGSSFDKTQRWTHENAQLTLTSGGGVLIYTFAGDSTMKYKIDFQYNATANVYVGYNVTPAVPASGTITIQPYVDYRPPSRYANGGDVLSFITPDATVYMGFAIWSIPG